MIRQVASVGIRKPRAPEYSRGLQTEPTNFEGVERIKNIAADSINLERRNRELLEDNQKLRNDLEVLTAENERLKRLEAEREALKCQVRTQDEWPTARPCDSWCALHRLTWPEQPQSLFL